MIVFFTETKALKHKLRALLYSVCHSGSRCSADVNYQTEKVS